MFARRTVDLNEIKNDPLDMVPSDFENNLEMLAITGVEDKL